MREPPEKGISVNMQNKKTTTTTKKSIKHDGLTGVIALALSMLTIPALAMIRIPKESDGSTIDSYAIREESTFSIKFDMSPTQEVVSIAPTGISQDDYDSNNFYLIQNYKTGEVMTLTPTEYIKGVVSAEMPISFHDEALKAQAITAHSYALRQIENAISSDDGSLNGAYLSNDPTKFQACFFEEDRKEYWGEKFTEYEEKLDRIVNEVIDQIAVVENEPIIGAFHAISTGATETAEEVWGQAVSYLVSTPSTGDKYAPNYETSTTLTKSEVEHALKRVYPSIDLDEDASKWFTQTELNESGRISSMKVGNEYMTGHELRTILELRSASFEINVEGEEITFTQIGYGHGVGLSQYGADYMARQGCTYDEILKHYYNGIDIITLI